MLNPMRIMKSEDWIIDRVMIAILFFDHFQNPPICARRGPREMPGKEKRPEGDHEAN